MRSPSNHSARRGSPDNSHLGPTIDPCMGIVRDDSLALVRRYPEGGQAREVRYSRISRDLLNDWSTLTAWADGAILLTDTAGGRRRRKGDCHELTELCSTTRDWRCDRNDDSDGRRRHAGVSLAAIHQGAGRHRRADASRLVALLPRRHRRNRDCVPVRHCAGSSGLRRAQRRRCATRRRADTCAGPGEQDRIDLPQPGRTGWFWRRLRARLRTFCGDLLGT